MGQLEAAITTARSSLAENNAKDALKVLKPFKKSLKSTNSSNVELHQIFADIYLDDGQLDKAYPLLVRACELDPEGKVGGSDKFFTLGQIAGGEDGISLLMQGIEIVSSNAGDLLKQDQADKIVSGLLSMIEIWMTDLCMEANAETQCEELIAKAMEVSESQSPEAWAMLGSIRISQQRFADAAEAFTQSWRFFRDKKMSIENSAQQEASNLHSEFVELLQPLLNLAKMCIEMGLYEIALEIEGAIKDIDEDNLEGIYLEGFTHYLICKLELFKHKNPSLHLSPENVYEFNQHFQELPMELSNDSIQEHACEARLILSYMIKLAENSDSKDEVAMELVEGAKGLLPELGGPADMADLIKFRKGEEIGDDEEIEFEDNDET
ncbi:LANO_0H05204g1_1 [Lachancea nothofagi CBS 11611]|uniref:LANO_0H05204g1_1 n=1 Tax=Lachancea nothofagi CBS 11611 TaxID=1266666 RepID=A0A1G4KLQ6_9SACH|nr:LANO_0H05204g1_1 [Lachancea nothofagi CBS 11611]